MMSQRESLRSEDLVIQHPTIPRTTGSSSSNFSPWPNPRQIVNPKTNTRLHARNTYYKPRANPSGLHVLTEVLTEALTEAPSGKNIHILSQKSSNTAHRNRIEFSREKLFIRPQNQKGRSALLKSKDSWIIWNRISRNFGKQNRKEKPRSNGTPWE